MSKLEPFEDLLRDKKSLAFVATVMPDGSPQVTPVWIDYDGEHVVFNTARGRVKEKNLTRDPRVSVAVADPDNLYRYVQVRGTARLTEDGADAHIDKLAKKYTGADTYAGRQPGERRVKVIVTPEAVNRMG
jgi:PPOX class probable F420-dependent enzyme